MSGWGAGGVGTSDRPARVAWITGAAGLIGHALVEAAPRSAPGWQVRGLTRQVVELTDAPAVEALFRSDRPGLVIHCAALSRSPACEADPVLARRINVEATARLAALARHIPFVFFSSDLVFDGQRGQYVESDAVNPLSVYAATKAEAEQWVRTNPRHLVVRTSLNGGVSPTGDRGFNEQMRRAWARGDTLKLFTDEYRSPIPASATAAAVWDLVNQNATGVFHVAGSERLSRWQIGQMIAARCPELNPRLEPGSLREYPGAPRSPDTSLDCAKAKARLRVELPGLTAWLAAHPESFF